MNHRSASLLLLDYRSGVLSVEEQSALEEHLSCCEECRGVLEAHDAMQRYLGAEGASCHPSPDEIVAFALADPSVDAEAKQRIEDHLEVCPSCREDVDRVRTIESSVEPGAGMDPSMLHRLPAQRALPLSRVSIAAGIALLVFLMGGLAGWVLSLCSGGGVVSTTPAGGELWSGAVSLVMLPGSLRGEAPEPSLSLDAGTPYVLLGVTPEPSLLDCRDGQLRFELRRDSGEALWSTRVTCEEAFGQLESVGAITLLVPTAGISSGRYLLGLYREVGAESTTVSRATFVIERKP